MKIILERLSYQTGPEIYHGRGTVFIYLKMIARLPEFGKLSLSGACDTRYGPGHERGGLKSRQTRPSHLFVAVRVSGTENIVFFL